MMIRAIELSGGLGNQMFQYAYAYAQTIQSPQDTILLDTRLYDRFDFHQGYELERLFILRVPTLQRFVVAYYQQHKKVPEIETLERGYWQSQDYFLSVADQLREDFTFPSFLDERDHQMAQLMTEETSVSLHVRRGDYLTGSGLYVQLGNTGYYERSIDYMQKIYTNPLFFVFSDDIDWCRTHLPLGENTVFVDWHEGSTSYRDMQLMTYCKHHIIANSTFSWWGAWLGGNPNKTVLAPERFFNLKMMTELEHKIEEEIIPASWTKIAVE